MGYRVELTDASQGFVDYLLKKNKNARMLNILTNDLETDYDLIMAMAVFLHFNPKELILVLNKVAAAFKPSGRLLFSLKVGKGKEVTSSKLDAQRYFCYYSADAINQLLTEIGFRPINIKTNADFRGKDRPDWLLVSALKSNS